MEFNREASRLNKILINGLHMRIIMEFNREASRMF